MFYNLNIVYKFLLYTSEFHIYKFPKIIYKLFTNYKLSGRRFANILANQCMALGKYPEAVTFG